MVIHVAPLRSKIVETAMQISKQLLFFFFVFDFDFVFHVRKGGVALRTVTLQSCCALCWLAFQLYTPWPAAASSTTFFSRAISKATGMATEIRPHQRFSFPMISFWSLFGRMVDERMKRSHRHVETDGKHSCMVELKITLLNYLPRIKHFFAKHAHMKRRENQYGVMILW